MDRSRFLELQYLTLRHEIETCLDRAFKIMVGGATLIPILVGALAHYSATPILMALPMIIVVMALLYLNQWNSIMRCGRYIRTKIEADIMGDNGWEAWLESKFEPQLGHLDNRLVDTYLAYAFYLLSSAYYFATTYIAVTYAADSYGLIHARITAGVYILIGVLMGGIFLRRVPTNTTTQQERAATPMLHHPHDTVDAHPDAVDTDHGAPSRASKTSS